MASSVINLLIKKSMDHHLCHCLQGAYHCIHSTKHRPWDNILTDAHHRPRLLSTHHRPPSMHHWLSVCEYQWSSHLHMSRDRVVFFAVFHCHSFLCIMWEKKTLHCHWLAIALRLTSVQILRHLWRYSNDQPPSTVCSHSRTSTHLLQWECYLLCLTASFPGQPG